MPCATIVVTDNTQKPASLLTLLQKGNQAGFTVTPQLGSAFGAGLSTLGEFSYLSIQNSPRNSGVTVYKGDENMPPGSQGGTAQGKELAAGVIDVMQAYSRSAYLGEVFLTASANGAIINVEYHLS